mmetsp:Transcript_20340/g.47297  ORF Transcript_20340/g.47297 Transcript_20340/m.47297 type:complete len:121 (-) Transcript_20340:133-495(-)
MGIMMFATAIFTWLPPLVFSILNESGVNMAWGLASLNLYFIVAMLCLLQIGNYTSARSEASNVTYRQVNEDGHVQGGTAETSSIPATAAKNIRAHLPVWGNQTLKDSNANIHTLGDHELI